MFSAPQHLSDRPKQNSSPKLVTTMHRTVWKKSQPKKQKEDKINYFFSNFFLGK